MLNNIFLKMTLILIVMSALFLTSCDKEEDINTNNPSATSNSSSEFGQYSKEVVVTDKTGENKAFYRIYSNKENTLSQFLTNIELTLTLNGEKVKGLIQKNNIEEQSGTNTVNNNLDENPEIYVELLFDNMADSILNYQLNLNNNSKYIMGYPIGYLTSGSSIGAVHTGGYDTEPFITRFQVKKKWYSSLEYIGSNSTIYPTGAFYAIWDSYYDCQKRGIVVWPDRYESTHNYQIVYNRSEIYSRICTIGTYAGGTGNRGECYVSSSPVGTSAFVYNNNFYYTPLNGNECTMTGTWFDGSNCFYMDIPANTIGYTWTRNFLVKSQTL